MAAGLTGRHCLDVDRFTMPLGGLLAVMSCPTCHLHVQVVAERTQVDEMVALLVSSHHRFEHVREAGVTA